MKFYLGPVKNGVMIEYSLLSARESKIKIYFAVNGGNASTLLYIVPNGLGTKHYNNINCTMYLRIYNKHYVHVW